MPVRLVHLSDLHIGASRSDSGIAEQILRRVAAFQPDLVVISGDLTHRARPREFAQARDFLDAISSPLFLIPGNHDVPHLNLLARVFDPFERYRVHIDKELEPVYHSPQVVLAAVNTVRSVRFHQGRLDESQLDSLEHVFGDVAPTACRVLVTHHALVGPPGGRIKQPMPNRLRILRRLEDLGVNLVLSGHVHEAFCGSSRDFCYDGGRGVVLCQAGLGAERPRPGWTWETNTFNCVVIEDDSMTVGVYAYDPRGRRFELTGEHRFPRWHLEERAAVQ